MKDLYKKLGVKSQNEAATKFSKLSQWISRPVTKSNELTTNTESDFLCNSQDKEIEIDGFSESYLTNFKVSKISTLTPNIYCCQAPTLNTYSIISSENEQSRDFNSEVGDCYSQIE